MSHPHPKDPNLGKFVLEIKDAKAFIIKHKEQNSLSHYVLITNYNPFVYYHVDNNFKCTPGYRKFLGNFSGFKRYYDGFSTTYSGDTTEFKNLIELLMLEML